MKKREAYPFSFNEDKTLYRFISTGPKGNIEKIVSFFLLGKDIWNLAFGDALPDGDFDDSVISDNEDMRKVVQTVANIAIDFFEKHPKRTILIDPLDRKRKLLYNRIFKEKADEIAITFLVQGIFKENWQIEKYASSQIYDAFILSTKSTIFEK